MGTGMEGTSSARAADLRSLGHHHHTATHTTSSFFLVFGFWYICIAGRHTLAWRNIGVYLKGGIGEG